MRTGSPALYPHRMSGGMKVSQKINGAISDEWRDESESENKWSDSESIEILSAII